MEIEWFEKVKKWALIGLFSDDELMDTLVLKGGNAIDLVYHVASRASMDLDLSIEYEFDETRLDTIREQIQRALERSFAENGYTVFDVTLEKKPEISHPSIPPFWGGYQLEFKLISAGRNPGNSLSLTELRREAEILALSNGKKFRVDISKHEYCGGKAMADLDGYTIYVYTPEMIVFEKLRAICQQTEDYCKLIGRSHRQARARDFFDIHAVVESFQLDLVQPTALGLLKNIFSAKQVPLRLLLAVRDHREFHRPDFAAVVDTLKPNVRVQPFDFYFDYVVAKCERLIQTLGII